MTGLLRQFSDSLRTERHAAPLALVLAALVFVAYGPAYRAGFIWDDDLHVTANPVIVGPQGLKEIWTTPAANYFPLTMTSFWALHALFGLNPLPYHVVNVALHAASAVLLWVVLRRLRMPGAWLGAALWGLHPVQVESVAWISELKNTQSAEFFLLAIWFYVRWVEAREPPCSASSSAGESDPRPARQRTLYALALASGVCAVLSKSSTVMLPVVLLLCRWWLTRRWSVRRLVELAPFFVVSLAVSGWTIWEQKYSSGAAGADWSHSIADRLAIAGRVPWFYLGKLLWPEPLIFIYPRWEIAGASFAVFVPGLAALAIVGRLFRQSARGGWAHAGFFAVSTFVVLLFPVLGLFDVYFFRFSFVGDHFQYLASMAVLALAAGVLVRLPGTARAIAAVAVISACAVLTWRQARIYRSDLDLFQATVADNPNAWMAHNNLSAALADAGRIDEAITHARRAVALRADYAEAENNLGRALTLAGRPAEALSHVQRALQLDPAYGEAHLNAGVALAALNRDAEAIASFATSVRLDPGSAKANYNLGLALAKTGQLEKAVPHFAEAVRLDPHHATAEMSWGLALAATGRFTHAVPHLERAIQLAPLSAEIHAGYGRALAVAGRLADAQARLREALRLDPNYADAHLNLALILQHLGRSDEAARHFQEARRLGAPK